MAKKRRFAAIAVEYAFTDATRQEMERAADQVMAALLADPRIEDPSVSLNLRTGTVEVEILIPEVSLQVAAQMTKPIVDAAFASAGCTPSDGVERKMELVDA